MSGESTVIRRWSLVKMGFQFLEKDGMDGGVSDGRGCFLNPRLSIGFVRVRACLGLRDVVVVVGRICPTTVLRRFGIGLPLQYLLDSCQLRVASCQKIHLTFV